MDDIRRSVWIIHTLEVARAGISCEVGDKGNRGSVGKVRNQRCQVILCPIFRQTVTCGLRMCSIHVSVVARNAEDRSSQIVLNLLTMVKSNCNVSLSLCLPDIMTSERYDCFMLIEDGEIIRSFFIRHEGVLDFIDL